MEIITNLVSVFDIGFSFCSRLFMTKFDTALNMIFGGSFSFTTIIYSQSIVIDVPDFGIFTDLARDIFGLMFGWTKLVAPVNTFGFCVILGVFGNFVFITIIHWVIKLIKDFNPLS